MPKIGFFLRAVDAFMSSMMGSGPIHSDDEDEQEEKVEEKTKEPIVDNKEKEDPSTSYLEKKALEFNFVAYLGGEVEKTIFDRIEEVHVSVNQLKTMMANEEKKEKEKEKEREEVVPFVAGEFTSLPGEVFYEPNLNINWVDHDATVAVCDTEQPASLKRKITEEEIETLVVPESPPPESSEVVLSLSPPRNRRKKNRITDTMDDVACTILNETDIHIYATALPDFITTPSIISTRIYYINSIEKNFERNIFSIPDAKCMADLMGRNFFHHLFLIRTFPMGLKVIAALDHYLAVDRFVDLLHVDFNTGDCNGLPPIIYALCNGHLNCVIRLLNHRSNRYTRPTPGILKTMVPLITHLVARGKFPNQQANIKLIQKTIQDRLSSN